MNMYMHRLILLLIITIVINMLGDPPRANITSS